MFAIVLAVFIAFAFRDVLSVPGFRDVLWGLLLEEPQSRLLSLNAGVGIDGLSIREAWTAKFSRKRSSEQLTEIQEVL